MGVITREREYLEFRNNFKDHINSKIVLYGTGRVTADIISLGKEFNFIGLADKDESLIGTTKYGLLVMSRRQIEEEADILIINTLQTYWRTIYNRISDWNIPIYFRNGNRAVKDEATEMDSLYASKDSLMNLINNSDVVSFDLFDTIITRCCLWPDDVYRLLNEQIKDVYLEDYIEMRKRASSALDFPDLNEIYSAISIMTGISQKNSKLLMTREISTDKALLMKRPQVILTLKYALEKKKVYIVSDTYYDSQLILYFLETMGIELDKDSIIVSCEKKASKEDGTIWKYIRREMPDNVRILHIGDSTSDVLTPEEFKITSFKIPSVRELLEFSRLNSIVDSVSDIYGSIALGLIGCKLFADPFKKKETEEGIQFDDLREAGYCLFGPILYAFSSWLAQKIKEKNDNQIAFLGRDGFLIKKAFDFYCKETDIKDIDTYYIETSRIAMLYMFIENDEDIYNLLRYSPYNGSVYDLVYSRFFIAIDQRYKTKKWYDFSTDDEAVKALVKEYQSVIICNAQKAKKNYKKYLHSKGLYNAFSIVDSQLNGTVQYYLGKIANVDIRGYYFNCSKKSSNPYSGINDMEACFFEDRDGETFSSAIYDFCLFVESFFTSNEGMFQYIDDNGCPVRAKKGKCQRYFFVREEMLEGAKDYMQTICRLNISLGVSIKGNNEIIDRMFGVFMNSCIPLQEMREGFWVTNEMAGTVEYPVFG